MSVHPFRAPVCSCTLYCGQELTRTLPSASELSPFLVFIKGALDYVDTLRPHQVHTHGGVTFVRLHTRVRTCTRIHLPGSLHPPPSLSVPLSLSLSLSLYLSPTLSLSLYRYFRLVLYVSLPHSLTLSLFLFVLSCFLPRHFRLTMRCKHFSQVSFHPPWQVRLVYNTLAMVIFGRQYVERGAPRPPTASSHLLAFPSLVSVSFHFFSATCHCVCVLHCLRRPII